jgi:hypothetical protein
MYVEPSGFRLTYSCCFGHFEQNGSFTVYQALLDRLKAGTFATRVAPRCLRFTFVNFAFRSRGDGKPEATCYWLSDNAVFL